jgi:hypothetical protein
LDADDLIGLWSRPPTCEPARQAVYAPIYILPRHAEVPNLQKLAKLAGRNLIAAILAAARCKSQALIVQFLHAGG